MHHILKAFGRFLFHFADMADVMVFDLSDGIADATRFAEFRAGIHPIGHLHQVNFVIIGPESISFLFPICVKVE